jgi:hypothetical protein
MTILRTAPLIRAGCCELCTCGVAGVCPECAYRRGSALADDVAAGVDPTAQAAIDAAKGYIDQGITAAMIYHGYRRTGSIVWALIYGLAGREAPALALPIALAQGFGAKKTCP